MERLFGADYPKYHTRLLRYLRSLSVPVEDAHDLAQETLLRAYEMRDRYRPQYPLWVWLRTIARNLAIDYFRRQRIEHRLFVPWETLPESHGRELSIDWDGMELERALERVPEPYRTTLELWRAGYEYAEIARELGICIGTVRSRLARAKQFLAQSSG